MKKILLIICSIISLHALGQDSLKHEIKYFVGNDGKLYWNRYLPFYLTISPTSNSNNGLLLESKATHQYANPAYWDSEGIHYIKHSFAVDQKTKKIVVPEIDVVWEIYADGIAPVTTLLNSKSNKYKKDNIDLFGKALEITLKATDNLSGIEKTYYSINEEKWIEYNDTLKFNQEGEYSLKYYSTDNVGNVENYNSLHFFVDLTAPISNYLITGISLDGNILSANTLINLSSEDKTSGVAKIYYQIDKNPEVLYKGGNIPISNLSNDSHILTYWAVDNVGNVEEKQVFEFYLDKFAPILTGDVLGDRYIVNNQVYFSGRTKMKLTAVDNKAGIKEIMYSVDGEDFNPYKQPFYLPTVQGYHVVRYFAIDNVGNNTQLSEKVDYQLDTYKYNVNKIYVDLIGPSLNHSFLGDYFSARDTLFINSKTKITLSGKDNESGLQYLSYSLNDTLEETRYDTPFSVAKAGFNKLEYFGYDNVNNRNKSSFHFIVDNDPPELKYNFSIAPIGNKNGADVYPDYVILYLAASDLKVGTKAIYYSINGAPEKVFSRFIDGFVPKTEYTIKVRAIDKLNNENIQEIKFYTD